MNINAIRPDGPTTAIEHQATGENPVHVTPEGIQPATQAAVPETGLNLKAAYDDLVKRLRKEASYWCTNCCYRAGDCNCFAPDDRKKDCDVYTKLQAADAIEELQDTVQAQDKALKLCADQLARRWTPVTERLPEEYKNVLCYYEYFRYGDYNCMFRTIDRGYYGNGIWGGEAGEGHKNKVLAWMPLPQPPKEVEP